MKMSLEGKRILIVGARGLLGRSLVGKVVDQGGTVIAADINFSTAEVGFHSSGLGNCKIVTIDVTSEESVNTVINSSGVIDGVVNCSYPRAESYGKNFYDVTYESFNENVSLHLGSAFLLMKECAKYFQQMKTNFSLVNISSIYGVVAPRFGIYNNTQMTMPVEYAAIKASIQHLNKYVSKYVADSRFRVNSVSPGGLFDNQPAEFCEAYKAFTNGEGMLDVRSILGAICFLLSDEAQFVTGQNIVVDDGFSL